MARILVIDDDAAMRVILIAMLTGAGHQVAQAPDGAAGLELYDARPADLVITDIEMPRKDGFEVMLALRDRNPRPPVIAISGGSFRSDPFLQMARLMGAACTLEKPFRTKQLVNAVKYALVRPSPSRRQPLSDSK